MFGISCLFGVWQESGTTDDCSLQRYSRKKLAGELINRFQQLLDLVLGLGRQFRGFMKNIVADNSG